MTQLSSGDAIGALASGTEAVELFRRDGQRVGEAIALVQVGQVLVHLGRSEDAKAQLQAALSIARAIKHPETVGEAELAMGEAAMLGGLSDEARQHFQSSRSVCAEAGDRKGEALAGWALGRLHLAKGQLDEAMALLQDALKQFNAFEMRAPWIGCLEDLASWAHGIGQAHLAIGLCSAAQRLREGAHLARSPNAQARWVQLLDELQSAVASTDYAAQWQLASEWDLGEVQRHALRLAPKAALSP